MRRESKAITLRGVSPEVTRVIQRRRSETGESVNHVVLELLEEGAGVRRKRRKVRHHDLDGLAGAWSRGEARQFRLALVAARTVDSELWK